MGQTAGFAADHGLSDRLLGLHRHALTATKMSQNYASRLTARDTSKKGDTCMRFRLVFTS